jgi:hypothetical protein
MSLKLLPNADFIRNRIVHPLFTLRGYKPRNTLKTRKFCFKCNGLIQAGTYRNFLKPHFSSFRVFGVFRG